MAARQDLLSVIKGKQNFGSNLSVTHGKRMAGQLASRTGNMEVTTHLFQVLSIEEKSHLKTEQQKADTTKRELAVGCAGSRTDHPTCNTALYPTWSNSSRLIPGLVHVQLDYSVHSLLPSISKKKFKMTAYVHPEYLLNID